MDQSEISYKISDRLTLETNYINLEKENVLKLHYLPNQIHSDLYGERI